MASPTLRQAVYAAYLASDTLVGLGYTQDTIFPNFSPDATPADRFLVLRWGITTRGIGGVNKVALGCWVYNREPDFAPIALALLEIRRIMPTLAGIRMSLVEAILGVDYDGDSDDMYDDGYRAHMRFTSHTITASGS